MYTYFKLFSQHTVVACLGRMKPVSLVHYVTIDFQFTCQLQITNIIQCKFNSQPNHLLNQKLQLCIKMVGN